MKRTYEAFAPDGTRFTRTSARLYTHAIVGQPREGDPWHICGFSGDPYNAAKVQNQMIGRKWGWWRADVVSAREVRASAPVDKQACPYCAPDEPCAIHQETTHKGEDVGASAHGVSMTGTSSHNGRTVAYGVCVCGAGTTNSVNRASVLAKLAAHAQGDNRGMVRS